MATPPSALGEAHHQEEELALINIYQLALRTPGIVPLEAFSRKIIRESLQNLNTDRDRPVSIQRFCIRVLELFRGIEETEFCDKILSEIRASHFPTNFASLVSLLRDPLERHGFKESKARRFWKTKSCKNTLVCNFLISNFCTTVR